MKLKKTFKVDLEIFEEEKHFMTISADSSAMSEDKALKIIDIMMDRVPEENKRMGCNHAGPICEA